ncbi:hypothetical protein EC396_07710 [Lutibacter sp. HS1-25]|uniref:cytochrome C oxidase subunit IV family protein n=1 Tax=Lutibacter sp. HS1-25 TaxID=2485000 RepID=UPI00101122C8|nr:cytochrome C oxidase subunit IV family protein [Lutibacter sp. HS1-25]RXP56151.1 hypothetical protein EC396_07710 [Lutibacter sp. HS1-25]
MKTKGFIAIWVVLIIITLLAAFTAQTLVHSNFIIHVILTFSAIKFLLVSFYFMEIKKAHAFWKASLIIFVLIFLTTTLFVI